VGSSVVKFRVAERAWILVAVTLLITGGVQSTVAFAVTITLVWPMPSLASTYVSVIVSPGVTRSTPAPPTVSTGIDPLKVAAEAATSVRVTVTPAGWVVEAIVTSTVSTTLLSWLRPQSETVIVTAPLHGYCGRSRDANPVSEQFTRRGVAASEKG
jgi:hypothetical protein